MGGEEKYRNGVRALEEGRVEEAVAQLAAALVEEETAERWNDWAAAQMACGRVDKAEEGFRRALVVEPAAAQAATNLGLLLASVGREQEAVPFLKQARGSTAEQDEVIREVLKRCSVKVAGDALKRSREEFQKLASELETATGTKAADGALAQMATANVARPLPIWDEDGEFARVCQKIEHITLDRVRCYILYQFAKQACECAGDVAEVGVYKGGSARLVSQTIAPRTEKTMHLFDTFAGMPATEAGVDLHSAGDFADTSLEGVRSALQDCANLRFYQGFFPDTAGPVASQKFCLVHVDVDIHKSVQDCCGFFYPRMEKGGIMLFDDYGFDSCPGARKAVDEFFADKPEKPFYLPTGQCFIVRESRARRPASASRTSEKVQRARVATARGGGAED